jgi:hypothetical protein
MSRTTQASLARELGISRQRVNRYIDRGMPKLGSGKLDREECLRWIEKNVCIHAKGCGAHRAQQLIRGGYADR